MNPENYIAEPCQSLDRARRCLELAQEVRRRQLLREEARRQAQEEKCLRCGKQHPGTSHVGSWSPKGWTCPKCGQNTP